MQFHSPSVVQAPVRTPDPLVLGVEVELATGTAAVVCAGDEPWLTAGSVGAAVTKTPPEAVGEDDATVTKTPPEAAGEDVATGAMLTALAD